MNKIYKLIWSKVKNCWVVTSEMANSHVKSTSGRAKGSVLAASVLTVLLGSALFPADMVYAADGAAHYVNVAVNTGKTIEARKYPGETIEESAIDPDVNYDLSANPTINAISIGAEASAWNNGAVAMGFKTIAKGEYATALGTGSAAYSKGDLALGWKAYTGWNEPNKIAIGTESTALKENGISIGTKSKTWYDNAIAIGNEAETGNKGGVTSNDSIAIGNKAKIQGQKNVAIGSEVTVGTGSTSSGSSYVVAIGSDSHAYDTDSVVVGGHSEVRENAVVVGNRSKAGMQSVAVGSDIKAGEWSVAIGLSSKAKNHAIAMGYSSEASAVDSVAFGNNASAKGLGAIAIGGNYDRPNEGAQAYSGDTIAIGRGSVAGNKEDTATVYNSVAVGREARAYGKNSIALGGTANVGDIWQKQLADGGTAIGSSANAAMENATAIGYKSIAYAKDAVTLGANTRADIADGVALGSESTVGRYGRTDIDNAGRYGYDPFDESRKQESPTWKSTKAAVSVGSKEKNITRQIVNVAAGTESTDAVNVAQLKNLKYRAEADLEAAEKRLNKGIQKNAGDISNLSTKVAGNTSSINYLQKQRDIDFKNLNQSIEGHTTRFVSVNRGNTNDTSDNYLNNGATEIGSIAIGHNAHANGKQAVTLGYNSFTKGQGSVIIGETSLQTTGGGSTKNGQFDQGIIVGSQNEVYARDTDLGGREDTILGSKNEITESHGTFVRGVGNTVYDAYNDEVMTADEKKQLEGYLRKDEDAPESPIGLFEKERSHVTVDGDGNSVAGAIYTRVSGVSNDLSNTEGKSRLSYNIITGNKNKLTDSSHNLILGDNHELENVNGNIIIGSQKTKTKTEKSNVTILGNDANVSEDGGVALGTGSVASTAAGVFGYDPATDKASTTDNATWKSGNGAVSVGTTDKTRQITNLAAGTADTDAVNVAQLKNSKTIVEAGDYVTVTKKTEDGKGTTYTVKGPKLTAEDNLTVTDDVDNNKKIGYKVKLNKDLTGLTSVTSDAFKVGDKTYINSQGINANNNKITNVAAGAADGDAVNFKQLSDVKTKVEANEGNITTNKNAIADLTPKVTTNTANIGKLQAGFTVKDAGEGKADVTLGGDTKQEVTFKAAVDKTTQATENGSSLTSAVDADRNVTYSLNMNQLKKDLGITDGPDGVMSSWKLKVKDETTPKEIKNGNTVTFEADGDGLTVARTDSTIKYTIDGSKLNIAQNQSITNLGKRIDNLDPIHYFSVNSTDKDAGSNYKNDGAKKDGSIAIGPSALNNGTQSVAVGLKSKVEDGWYSVALGTESKTNGHFTTAIGYQASATKLQALALGTNAEAAAESGISIGVKAKSLANRGIAVGTNSTVDQTGGRGIAIGDGAYVGAKTQGHLGTGMPNPGDAWNPSEPYLPVADDTVAGPGKLARENSMAIGMKASAFGFQTTALGAAAEAHDTNTTAVGAAAVAKGNYSTALGKQARTFDKESTSVGHWADSRAEFATALGSNTIVYKKGGVALGFGARAYDENSIAIGSNSFAKEAIDGKAYLSDEEVKAAAGIVSVGNPAYKVGDKDFAANYRRIVNVAGGIHDNDAVNVAQLKALEGKVTGNAGDITTLKEGWTLQDANKTVGTKTVKAKDTVTVTGDDYINATVNNDGLTLGMDETKLNKQINSQIDDSATVKAKMNSWVLKATSDKDAEKAGKTINNDNNAVTFDATGAGLTVTRDGSTITYGIDGKQIDISENETVAGLETEIKESKTTVEAAENSQITVTPKKQDDKSTKYVVDIAKDGTIGGTNDGNLVTGKTVKDYVDANKVTVTGDENGSGVKVENIAEDGKPANYKVSLGDKIKAGDVTVDGTKGAGQITGLSNTTWNADNIVSGRAATEDQLKAVSQNAAEAAKKHTTVVAGDYVTVSEGTNDNGGKEYTVNGPKVAVAKDEKNLVVGDIMDGDKKVGYELKLNKELTGLTSVSSDTFKSGEDVTINKDGLTIKEGPSVTTKGIDAGKKKITNVADGDVSATSTDAVNGKQLNEVKTKADTNEENITELQKGWTLVDAKTGKKVVKADNTVTVTGDEYINATVSDAGLKLGMNVNNLNSQINKQINTNPTVTGKMNSWVLKAATTDKDPAATGQTIDNTNNVATFDVEDDAQGLTVKRENSTIKYGVDKAKLAEHITGDVVTNINKGGEAVTNISAKFSVTDGTNTKAVNLGKDKNSNVKFLGTAGETTVTVGGDNDAPTITVGLDKEFKNQVNANSDNIATNKTAIEKNAGEITTLKGRVDGHDTAIAANTKAIGENKAAITQNAQDIATNKTAIGENKTAIAENKTNIATNTENIGKNADAIAENKAEISKKMTSWNLKAEGVDGEQKIGNDGTVTFDVVEKDKGLTVTREGSTIKYGIDGSKIDIKENETVKKLEEDIENSKTTVKAGDDNISVKKADGKNEYTLTLAEDLKGLKSISTKTVNASEKVTVGDNVTINNEGLTIKNGPSVTTKGIDAGNKAIANVADGKADTDAVNVRQLNAIASQGNQNIAILGGKVSELDGRVNRVGAGAAALAALHPLDFDPDDKWDFAAGYGNYNGANAVSIGAYYRPNEDTMFSVGGSFGGGENMVNAGVSVKLGQGNNVTTSKIAMAKEIKDLRAEVEVLRQAIVGVGQGQELDPMKMKLFPDIEKNHWAYEAVEELAKQGLLEGYPDGTFSGDRMMTRYEFAQVVYRAMQKGLKVNEKLIQEFEPELERFRIDVISKDKDGNPVIERVRVNDKKDVAETANA
ncbi:ESPR-type extended signal peptide-containing protein [Negativicoccus succinicivorans]|uniref:ESPR-type extended signal peptide-containing protein n=1 Tax=Negativicoccus succinicivorans TaxID=620903 RepID=UPI00290E3A28|nr:ESPR-type extended signal peptide-containing protein [Negativicoccus succinicivorans]MDU5530450.1 ESPR-type extended signal peptide-containing protein [Negativicoccus succinicivorans]